MIHDFEALNPSQAYGWVLEAIKSRGAACTPRGIACREIEDYAFQVRCPESRPIVTASRKRNEKIAKYTQAEFDLYESGAVLARDFAKAASFWTSIQNPDGTVNSAYGRLAFYDQSCGKSKFAKHAPVSPWDWARLSLLQDVDSRQAFVRFSQPKHQWFGNADQPCTMHMHFRIRGGKLNATVVMRSNDAVKGLVYDMPWFCHLMDRMQLELTSHYPDLNIGTYTHIAHSMHIYDADVPLVEAMLNGDANAAA